MDFERHNLQPEDAGGMVDGEMDADYIDHLNSALDWSEREIARLKAENAKLREERNHWHVEQVHAYGNWKDVHRYAAKLKVENAKLRALVADMWHDGMCDCDEFYVCAEFYGCAKCEYGYLERMRELGIEVKDD